MRNWEEKNFPKEVTFLDQVNFRSLTYFSSKRSDAHERRDDTSSWVANPNPCHLILPNLSSRNIYLRSKKKKKKSSRRIFVSLYFIDLSEENGKEGREMKKLIPREKIYYFELLSEVIMVAKRVYNLPLKWIIQCIVTGFPHQPKKQFLNWIPT